MNSVIDYVIGLAVGMTLNKHDSKGEDAYEVKRKERSAKLYDKEIEDVNVPEGHKHEHSGMMFLIGLSILLFLSFFNYVVDWDEVWANVQDVYETIADPLLGKEKTMNVPSSLIKEFESSELDTTSGFIVVDTATNVTFTAVSVHGYPDTVISEEHYNAHRP